MQRFKHSINLALQNHAWHAALAQALCIPDICGRLGSPGAKKDRMLYIDWFNKWMPASYHGGSPPAMTGGDCYALRCSYLHAGGDEVEGETVSDGLERFLLIADGSEHRRQSHLLINGSETSVEIHSFCEDLAQALVDWWDAVVVPDPQVQEQFRRITRIQDMSNPTAV